MLLLRSLADLWHGLHVFILAGVSFAISDEMLAGIVGITAAALGAHVMLTDTRDIMPQIYENVLANQQTIEEAGGSATVQELDWNDPDDEVRMLSVCRLHCCRTVLLVQLFTAGSHLQLCI